MCLCAIYHHQYAIMYMPYIVLILLSSIGMEDTQNKKVLDNKSRDINYSYQFIL